MAEHIHIVGFDPAEIFEDGGGQCYEGECLN